MQEFTWQNIALRPYQEAALSAWSAQGYRGIIVLPTGAGKTRLGLKAAALLKCKTLFLTPTKVLFEQWCREIRKFYDGPIGRYGDGERSLEPITVATYASAFRYMPEIGGFFDLMVIDEIHHFGDALKDEILEMSAARWRLGLTATPPDVASPLQALASLVGPVVYKKQIADLVGTYLAPFEIRSWHLALTPKERDSYLQAISCFRNFSAAFRKTQPQGSWHELMKAAAASDAGLAALAGFRRARRLVALTQAKFQTLCRLLKDHASQKTLIFTSSSESAYRLSKLFLIPAITADIKKEERLTYLEGFHSGALSVLISCRVLNEGFDIADAGIVIILGGSVGPREHIQRIGRALRPAPEKRAIIYELIAAGTFEVSQSRKRQGALYA
jgi:superfamily II DNA or RNA helicase